MSLPSGAVFGASTSGESDSWSEISTAGFLDFVVAFAAFWGDACFFSDLLSRAVEALRGVGLLVAEPTLIGDVGQGVEDFLGRDRFALSLNMYFSALWQLRVCTRIDETLPSNHEGFQVRTFGVLGADDEHS